MVPGSPCTSRRSAAAHSRPGAFIVRTHHTHTQPHTQRKRTHPHHESGSALSDPPSLCAAVQHARIRDGSRTQAAGSGEAPGHTAGRISDIEGRHCIPFPTSCVLSKLITKQRMAKKAATTTWIQLCNWAVAAVVHSVGHVPQQRRCSTATSLTKRNALPHPLPGCPTGPACRCQRPDLGRFPTHVCTYFAQVSKETHQRSRKRMRDYGM